MGRFPVSPAKEKELYDRMNQLGVKEEELTETFVRSSGKGGQRLNKASTCVILVHQPSGLSVRCQQERSQALNRYLARRILLDKIEARQLGEQSARERERERIRRQKRKRSKRAKEKILANKRHQAEKKLLRAPVRIIDE
ncbi:MAG: peptide chain release factor-like protein [bacterium]|nr:peptide chain release factor-like protein [bacterium]